MKTLGLSCSMLLGMVMLFDAVSFAQQPAKPSATASSAPVAVVDIPLIFKNHSRFKQKMDAIKIEVEAFEKQINEERKKLAKQDERLKTFAVGSPEFRQLEEDLARQVSDLRVSAELKRKDVMDREAKVFFETYNEVSREVARLATEYGISLVLRYDSEPIDGRDRGSILSGINRPIVFQNNLDLTQLVLKQLNGVDARRPMGIVPMAR